MCSQMVKSEIHARFVQILIISLLNIVHGQVQKSQQKPRTKESNEFPNHSIFNNNYVQTEVKSLLCQIVGAALSREQTNQS